ncbi:MAG: response regulator [Bacteroidia bacterium]
MRGHILVIEDEKWVFEDLKLGLGQAHVLHYADSLSKVNSLLKKYPIDLVFADLNFQADQNKRLSGLKYIKTLREKHPTLTIIVLSQYSDTDRIVRATQNGADHYFIKTNLDTDSDEFREQVRKWINRKKRLDQARELKKDDAWGKFVFPESTWEELLVNIVKKKSFFLIGESGLGKHLLLQKLYHSSPYFNEKKEAQTIDLSLYSENALNQFLHSKRGSGKANFFRQSSAPLLFLRNLDLLPLSIQEKFLELIAQKKYLLSEEPFRVQLVFVLEKEPKELILQQKLSPELVRFLPLVVLRPLRERQNELITIIEAWQKGHAYQRIYLKDDTIRLLKQYPFPANITELYAVLEETFLNHKKAFPDSWQSQMVKADCLPARVLQTASNLHEDMHLEVAKVQLKFIEDALKKFAGERQQKSLAAQLLKVHSADNLKKTFINKYWAEYPSLVKSFPTIMKKYKLNEKH